MIWTGRRLGLSLQALRRKPQPASRAPATIAGLNNPVIAVEIATARLAPTEADVQLSRMVERPTRIALHIWKAAQLKLGLSHQSFEKISISE